MIKSVILDDEKHSVETLKWKIEKFCPEVHIVATFNDPQEAYEFLLGANINLLFIDIEMPRMNGFEVLRKLGNISFDVIFTTAYDEFGIKAIKFSALDYLLKPIQTQELSAAIEKHKQKSAKQISSEQLKVLFSNIKEDTDGPVKIALATKESIEFVQPHEIIACEADSNYTRVFMADGRKKLISKTLKEFEELLGDHHFFRSHHSHLVNTNHIKEYVRTEGGYLLMSNKLSIPVSRSKREEILRLF